MPSVAEGIEIDFGLSEVSEVNCNCLEFLKISKGLLGFLEFLMVLRVFLGFFT